MPYFRITYTAAGGKSHTGIKEYHIRNIDDAFDYFLGKAKAAGFVTDFSCVMISTKSDEYKNWLAAKEARRRNLYNGELKSPGPGKYRH